MRNSPERRANAMITKECKIFLCDCTEFVKQIPDESIQLIISSPPYCMGKEYEDTNNVQDFLSAHLQISADLVRILKPGGSLCWQVGYHAKNSVLVPLDYLSHAEFSKYKELRLRNRIIWSYGHGLHASKRFSGRHETVLWYTKGKEYKFNLDAIRIPQKYPGKRSYKGENLGQYSSNPLGKNPGDVWEIPVVNSSHVEKTEHPCQFPHALAQRLILALSDAGDVVLDPFLGSGTTAAAAIVEKRMFIGCELKRKYYKLAVRRAEQALSGTLDFRRHDKPVLIPNPNSALTRRQA